jgi:hypothetical protein
MLRTFRLAVVLLAIAAIVRPVPCQAYVERIKVPLTGCRAYSTGRGHVLFTQDFGEGNRVKGGTIIVEINNVPLPAGTELQVLIQDQYVGKIKLNADRNGRLVLESSSKWIAPRLNESSSIIIKLPAGPNVMW